MRERRRIAGGLAAAVCWIPLGLVLVIVSVPAHAWAGVVRVLGDSLSQPPDDGGPSWSELAFGEAAVTWAVGGASTDTYLAGCDPDCYWLGGAHESDVWWILIGSNELARNPDATAETYRANLLSIIDLIPSEEVHLLSSPWAWDLPNRDRSRMRAFFDEQAAVDLEICALIAHVTCAADLRFELDRSLHYAWDGIHMNSAGHARVASVIAVPEPQTAMLLAIGLVWLGARRK